MYTILINAIAFILSTLILLGILVKKELKIPTKMLFQLGYKMPCVYLLIFLVLSTKPGRNPFGFSTCFVNMSFRMTCGLD